MENLIKLQDFKGIFEYVFKLERHKKSASNSSGIYFLFKDEVVVYIGISQNIYERVLGSRGHILSKNFDSFSFIEINKDNRDLEKLEYFLISFFHPIDNSTNRGFELYTNLPLEYKEKRERKELNLAYQNALLMHSYFDNL